MQSPPNVHIDIVSDVMCPWCYIGHKRLEKALTKLPDIEVTKHWRPFQLDETLPDEGLDRSDYLSRKFGSAERAASIYSNIEEAGLQEGIHFAFEKIKKSPNTMNCHRLIRWAYPKGKQDQVVEELFRLYFIEGADLSQTDTLVKVSQSAGMDSEIVRELLATDSHKDVVKSDIDYSRTMLRVTGVPTFIFDGKYSVVGAESSENLRNVFIRLAEEKLHKPQAQVKIYQ